MKLWFCALLFCAAGSASARKTSHRVPVKPPGPTTGRTIGNANGQASKDPTHWFASRTGLIRIYEGRAAGREDLPPAGASCEVLESRPADADTAGTLRESCTMIIARRAKPSTELTYELRKAGIFMVRAKGEGAQEPQTMDRLVLPAPLRVGAGWRESLGPVALERNVRSAGKSCQAAGRSFADCLVLAVVQRQGKKTLRKYTETYAAGVGLVEDAQWELVDVKGL